MSGTSQWRKRLWVSGTAFGVLSLAGIASTWRWWGVGFEEAEAHGVPAPTTDAAMVSSFWVAVLGVLGLILVGVCAAIVMIWHSTSKQ